MKGFENKVVVVIGGGMGLGRALCEELASSGASVVVADINEGAANAVANAIVTRMETGRHQLIQEAERTVRHCGECKLR